MEGVQPLSTFKSIDGGKNWLVISNPTPPLAGNSLAPALITDLVVDPSNYNLIYASTMAYKFPSVFNFNANNKGVHKSEDGGTIWQAINNSSLGNLSQFPLYKLIIDSTKSTQLYLVAGLNGVFKSSNGGTNWEQINKSGMVSDTYVITATLAGNRLYTLTSSGVYIISIAPSTIGSKDTVIIGNIIDTRVIGGCSCRFEKSDTNGRMGVNREIFFGANYEINDKAWMNINGRDVELLPMSPKTASKENDPSHPMSSVYTGEGITVSLDYRKTGSCPPEPTECEVYPYDVTVTLEKGGLRETVTGKGSCGC